MNTFMYNIEWNGVKTALKIEVVNKREGDSESKSQVDWNELRARTVK